MTKPLLLAAVCFVLPVMGEEETGFTPLTNGKDLTGWSVVNAKASYTLENGDIVGRGKNLGGNSFLRTDKTYKDFDFRFEMKFEDLRGNSGVMFRGLQKGGKGRVYGYQCEHDNGKNRAWTAGLYDEARRGWLVPSRSGSKGLTEEQQKTHSDARNAFTERGKSLMKWDDWNQIRILCKGRHIQIWLNGVQTVDYTDEGEDFTPEGFLALQVHAGKACNVRWRNLRIQEL